MLTAEDLDYRKNKIGASDAPIIAGISPWKTPYELWEEKLGLRSLQKMTDSMQRGIDLEETARQEFIKMTGIHVKPLRKEHSFIPWMMASFDGISDCGEYAVEIKCPGSKAHEIAKNNRIPEYYSPQLQHQMCVADIKEMFYFSFDGSEGAVVIAKKSQDQVDALLKQEEKFYQCMMDFKPPEEPKYKIRSDNLWNVSAEEWLSIKNQLSYLEKKEQNLREALIKLAEEENSYGAGIKLSKMFRKGSIDYTKIPELQNIDLEKYRKIAIEYWSLLTLKEKT